MIDFVASKYCFKCFPVSNPLLIDDFIKLRERNNNEIFNINKSINVLLKKPNNNNINNHFLSPNDFLEFID